MSSTDEHIVGTPAGRQLARAATRRPGNMVEGFVCRVVCTPSEPRLSVLPRSAGTATKSWKGLDPRLGARHALEGVAHTLTSAEPGWKSV